MTQKIDPKFVTRQPSGFEHTRLRPSLDILDIGIGQVDRLDAVPLAFDEVAVADQVPKLLRLEIEHLGGQ